MTKYLARIREHIAIVDDVAVFVVANACGTKFVEFVSSDHWTCLALNTTVLSSDADIWAPASSVTRTTALIITNGFS